MAKRRSRWLLGPLLAGLSLASTAVGREGPSEAVFAAAFSRIADTYLDPVDIKRLAVDGLSSLTRLEPRLSTAVGEDGALHLSLDGGALAELPLPRDQVPVHWSQLVMRTIERARSASPALKATGGDEITQAVLDAVVADLDPYSRYAGGSKASDERSQRDGYGGVGIVLAAEPARENRLDRAINHLPHALISEVMPHSPAAAAGIRIGDSIVAIDSQDIGDATAEQIGARLRGPVGSAIELTVSRAGTARRVTLRRDRVVPNTVTAHVDGNVALLRIERFNAATALNLRDAIVRLRAEARPKGFILDLRGNPGGLLDQAVAVADEFVTSGRILTTEGRHPDSLQRYDATPDDQLDGLPLVVLIDGKSASAAEIVAAALQDSGRAVLVGSSTFGKGSVQTVTRLPNDGELFLTWSRIYAPSGYTLHRQGVQPTVCTTRDSSSVRRVVADIDGGRLTAISTLSVWRARAPEDESSLTHLRDLCPWTAHPAEFDVDVAKALLANDRLYHRALSAGITSVAEHRN